jgi:hypothetical protein
MCTSWRWHPGPGCSKHGYIYPVDKQNYHLYAHSYNYSYRVASSVLKAHQSQIPSSGSSSGLPKCVLDVHIDFVFCLWMFSPYQYYAKCVSGKCQTRLVDWFWSLWLYYMCVLCQPVGENNMVVQTQLRGTRAFRRWNNRAWKTTEGSWDKEANINTARTYVIYTF